jgi:DNA-binding FadR family transcriptional regulator
LNTRVSGQNLTYSIAHHIGIAIVTGVYSKDNPIPIEADLCQEYGASRPVLREAVKMLTAKIPAVDCVAAVEGQKLANPYLGMGSRH